MQFISDVVNVITFYLLYGQFVLAMIAGWLSDTSGILLATLLLVVAVVKGVPLQQQRIIPRHNNSLKKVA